MAAAIPIVLSVVGTALSAQGAKQQGQDIQQANIYQARQLEQNAGQAKASGQIEALNQGMQTSLMVSRARAIAAASGGGVSDPTVVNIMSRIAGEGAYRENVARYNGDTRAREMNMQAQSLRFGGQQAVNAGNINSAATLMSGGANAYSMYSKYGMGTGTNKVDTTPQTVN